MKRNFPDGAVVQLRYRIGDSRAPVLTETFPFVEAESAKGDRASSIEGRNVGARPASGKDDDPTAVARPEFELRWNRAENELRPLLRMLRGPAVYLEDLELRLERSKPFASVSLHPAVPIEARFRIFQHGYQSWGLSLRRTHRDADRFARPKWKHAVDENFETPHQTRLPRWLAIWHALPARGRFHSEGLIGLEQISGETRAEQFGELLRSAGLSLDEDNVPDEGRPFADSERAARDAKANEADRSDAKARGGDAQRLQRAAEPVRMLFAGGAPVHHFLKFRVLLDPHSGRLQEFAAVWDFNGRLFSHHSRESLTPLRWEIDLPQRKPRPRRSFAVFLDEAAKRLREQFHKVRTDSPVIGWCSWYYYYTKINEGIILDNLRRIREHELRMELFQVDDGWQQGIGDWTKTNAKFPSGMQSLSAEIRAAGLRPGIWLAPFIVQKGTELLRDYPEMVLCDERDRPVPAMYNPNWGGWAYSLDVTHPRFKAWLSNTIDTIVREWGYSYLKLDFLFAACFRGRRSQQTQTGARALHEALVLIRRVAGRKTFLLGCGAPLWPSIGILDGMRIGMDVNHIWSRDWIKLLLRDRNYPTTRGALINTINRSFMHHRFWINDPDCLMVRGRDTKLTEEQVYLMASVMALSGGMLLLSDDLSKVERERLEIWKRAVWLARKTFYYTPLPLGMLDHAFPRGLYSPAGYLGVWNPTKRPARVELTLPPGLDEGSLRGSRDYWTDQEIPWRVREDKLSIGLAPFESMIGSVKR